MQKLLGLMIIASLSASNEALSMENKQTTTTIVTSQSSSQQNLVKLQELIKNLPSDVLIQIFLHLDFQSAKSLRLVNQQMNKSFCKTKELALKLCPKEIILPEKFVKDVFETLHIALENPKTSERYLIAFAKKLYDTKKKFPQYDSKSSYAHADDLAAMMLSVYYLEKVFDQTKLPEIKLEAAETAIAIMLHFHKGLQKEGIEVNWDFESEFQSFLSQKKIFQFFRPIIFNPVIRFILPSTKGLEKYNISPLFDAVTKARSKLGTGELGKDVLLELQKNMDNLDEETKSIIEVEEEKRKQQSLTTVYKKFKDYTIKAQTRFDENYGKFFLPLESEEEDSLNERMQYEYHSDDENE